MAETKRTYTQDEVNEILKRALSRQGLREQTLSHEDLVQVAAEVGIDRKALDAATAEMAKAQAAETAKRNEEAELVLERRIQLRRLLTSGIQLGVVNVALYFIDMQTAGGPWYHWPLLASGVLLAMQLRHVVSPEQRLARRRARQERELRRAARRAQVEAVKQRLLAATSDAPSAAREFESAVQAGVTALVKVATKKLEEHLDRHDRRQQ